MYGTKIKVTVDSPGIEDDMAVTIEVTGEDYEDIVKVTHQLIAEFAPEEKTD